ncbi:helix-turn-helix domain-containing protein [Salinimonas sediminis]|uniref:Helix-turn-helix domain-containing protein n=1 Tax=Salinimonas sediminis TaxID=2303538 RepID=A0A346NL64_9ALTE|nr:helix-turn-helix domain-containing protein [Salinimonas sediminis]AXR06271.1 helix-turn-helix domain-containing protein [Salinimonas sediminis]
MTTRTLVLVSDKQLRLKPLLQALYQTAQHTGLNTAALLRGTGLFEEVFSQPLCISPSQLVRLLNNFQRLQRTPDSAFLVGDRLATLLQQDVATPLLYSPTLKHWLRAAPLVLGDFYTLFYVRRYIHQHDQYLVVTSALGTFAGWPLLHQILLSAFSQLLKQWGHQRVSLRYEFCRPTPTNIADYQVMLGTRLYFARPLDAIVVKQTITHLRPHSPQLDGKHIDATMPPAAVRTPYRPLVSLCRLVHGRAARRVTLPVVLRQLALNHSDLNLAEAARCLALSPATLKRRLADFNTSFSAICADASREQAVFLLSYEGLTNEQSALKMAVSDLTNFRRAVKRWTGLTPSQLRQR